MKENNSNCMQKPNIPSNVLQVLLSYSGAKLIKDEICGNLDVFRYLLEKYENIMNAFKKVYFVSTNDSDVVNIFKELGYTTIYFNNSIIITYCKKLAPSDIKYLTSDEKRKLCHLSPSLVFAPPELYDVIQERKEKEKERPETIYVNLDEL